jgi:putative FmdB family regulatory protein
VPTYVYKCVDCGEIHEVTCSSKQLVEIEDKKVCEKCGGGLARKLAPFVTHFNYTRRK